MKRLYTLHVLAMKNGITTTYVVTRHLIISPGSVMRQAEPQSWERFGRILEQLGRDAFKIAVLKKEIDAKGSVDIREVGLDEAGLRMIGFTDV